jgi:hypothetical protein
MTEDVSLQAHSEKDFWRNEIRLHNRKIKGEQIAARS